MTNNLTSQEHKQLVDKLTNRFKYAHDMVKELCKYNDTTFMNMVNRDGPVVAAKKVIAHSGAHKGFAPLTLCKHLELSVEAIVLEGPWSCLFKDDELEIARNTLIKLNYQF